MEPIVLRDGDPPEDVVVVVRGGAMESEFLRRTALDAHDEVGPYTVSVFLALDDSVEGLCAREPYLLRYGKVRLSTVGALRAAGFAVIPTLARPHYDVVLPDVAAPTLGRLEGCFEPPVPNPARQSGWLAGRSMDLMKWDLWVDYHRTDGDGFTHTNVRNAEPGVKLKQGAHVVVGNEEADPAVAEVMAVKPTGVVLVRPLPGPAEGHLHLVRRADVKAH